MNMDPILKPVWYQDPIFYNQNIFVNYIYIHLVCHMTRFLVTLLLYH